MTQDNPRDKMEQHLLEFADRYSVSRIKFSTINFDLDYRRNPDGELYLHTEKATIRTLGKLTKVPIGDGHPYQTFEEAEEATKKYWQEYYRKVRAKRSDDERQAEAKRQKRYRERRKSQDIELAQRQ